MFLLRSSLFFLGLFVFLLAAHLLHAGVLWGEEGLPLAVAMQMKHGAVLYRDVWFDKPPLVPAFYLLWGASAGPALRVAGALYCWLACLLACAAARRLWSAREGRLAAALLAFFLTFDTHSAVVPLAADLLLLVPHLAAIYFAWSHRPFWSGVAVGIGFLVNVKAALVLVICGVFLLSIEQLLLLLAGFACVNAAAFAALFAAGALPAYVDQVWRWPAQYASSPIVANPIANGAMRSLNWLGFHAALVIGSAIFLWRERRWQFAFWILLASIGVALGWRFFPRYYFILLPALVLMAARTFAVTRPRALLGLAALTMLIPLVRFAPRYVSLSGWSDLALDRNGRDVAQRIAALLPQKGTLYVWGYRPEIFVYTGFRPATRFLDSQAMTGVPADRHLTQSTVVLTKGTRDARLELARSQPDVIADGLSLFNPALAIGNYEELRPWLAAYREAARVNGTIIYVRR